MADRIPLAELFSLIGRRLFGDEWIGGLSGREKHLILTYPSAMMPWTRIFIDSGNALEMPADPALRCEIEHARDRDYWRANQVWQVKWWLGLPHAQDWFNEGAQSFERITVEDSVRQYFGDDIVATSAAPARAEVDPQSPAAAPSRGRRGEERKRVGAEIEKQLDDGNITIADIKK